MTEPGGSRRTPEDEVGRPPVHGDATVADGAPYRSDGGVDTAATGRDERVLGESIDGRTAVDRPRDSGSDPRSQRSRECFSTRTRGVVDEREARGEPEVTVLHVDDDPDVGPLVCHFLEDVVERVTVVTETDSAVALDRIARVDVDCVVSDLDMPGRDGLDLAMAIDATHPDVPVVLFTSRDWQTVAGETGSEHVSAYVRKEGGHRQFERLARRVRALLT